VAGILRGSDATRRNEYVAVSAHLDHLGVGEPINGDRIYNGAMDNASGIAAILEVAHTLHESGVKPARSILFVAVTSEENGLLGSRYFAAHPTVPAGSIVANINTDMFLPLFPLKTLMVLGLDESDLGRDIRATAKELGLGVQADPEPQRNRFVRSDQYSFIRAGIPALAMIGNAGTHLLIARLGGGEIDAPAGMSGKQTFGKAALARARAAQDQRHCRAAVMRRRKRCHLAFPPPRKLCRLKGPSRFPGFGSPTYAVFPTPRGQ
jgi:Zn-dependent M28 family amino/carboxypeptidase